MFREIGYILISFFIAYLAFEGVLYLLERDYGIKLPIGESMFLSYNGGENWIAIDSFDRNIARSSALSFNPGNPQELYLASPRGILYSTNKGKNFQEKETKFETETTPILVSKIIYSEHDQDNFYIISEEIGRNKILVSYNRGETFRPVFISQSDNKVSAFSTDPFYPHVLYIGTEKGIFLKSEDFGETWEENENFPQEIGQVALNPHKYGEIYVLLSVRERDPFDYWSKKIPAKLMISQDKGDTFRELKSLAKVSGVKQIIFDPNINHIYFISNLSVYKKTNKGIDILKIISPSGGGEINSFTTDPKNSKILYLGIGNLVYKSEDGGNNWHIIESPTIGEIKEIRINPRDPQTIFLSIENIL